MVTGGAFPKQVRGRPVGFPRGVANLHQIGSGSFAPPALSHAAVK
jgi:hypothetical protein